MTFQVLVLKTKGDKFIQKECRIEFYDIMSKKDCKSEQKIPYNHNNDGHHHHPDADAVDAMHKTEIHICSLIFASVYKA
jgi:hypothetical protein